jgi:hypothetical protein
MSSIEDNHEKNILMKRCDIKVCEGMCCYDGVYLMDGEESFLKELVIEFPELKEKLPSDFVVDGFWNGEFFGRKTATRPHEYKNPNFPKHFTNTRCVFADREGYCELEKLGREKGLHPWSFKPATCWLFPLSIKNGELLPPPISQKFDPYISEGYDGYVTFVPCGKHHLDGETWPEALDAEVKYFEEADQLPLLGNKNNTVKKILALIKK